MPPGRDERDAHFRYENVFWSLLSKNRERRRDVFGTDPGLSNVETDGTEMSDSMGLPKAFNQEFRQWIKDWCSKTVDTLVREAGVRRDTFYEIFRGDELIPRETMMKLIEAAAPDEKDGEEPAVWTSRQKQYWSLEWEQARLRRPSAARRTGAPGPMVLPAAAVAKLDAARALPALDQVSEIAIRQIAASHVYIAPRKTPVGYHEQVPIGVYVDLHSAACDPVQREALAVFLAERVASSFGDAPPVATAIATPREGNTLVGARVAELCGLPFLMVRTKRAPRFGFPVEGTFGVGGDAIIVDDLVMGSLIARTARLLRKHGLNVRRCFSIFERLDADPRGFLLDEGINLDSAFGIDDEVLEDLRSRGARIQEIP